MKIHIKFAEDIKWLEDVFSELSLVRDQTGLRCFLTLFRTGKNS